MSRYELGEAIATRVLMLEVDGPNTSEVIVSLGKPQQDGRDVYCTYEIKGAGRAKVMRVYGVDGFQAIALAITALRAEIEALNKEFDGKLQWEAGPVNDFGSPPHDQA
jgi:hypothetical protein